MSDVNDEVKFSLTLMINKEKSKVLFASVDNAFVDVLLSFLTLPMGRILKLLDNHYGGDKAPTIGSLITLYNGLQNLDSSYFCTRAGKQMLLNPRSSLENECRKLKINVCGTPSTMFFTCVCASVMPRVCLYNDGAVCTHCGKIMNTEIEVGGSDSHAAGVNAKVFTEQEISFLISDDLQMLPNVTGSIINNLKKWGIMDVHGAELKIVTVGFNEMMDLLKLSLLSRSPLTDLFLHNGRIHHPAPATSEPLSVYPQEEKSNSKKMKIKVMVQKSSNKFLFAEAGVDFVEFLFSFLTIPLGQVECLLSMNACLGSADNLYRSFSNIDSDKCLVTKYTKDVLLKPKLPPKYLSNKQFFPLEEQPTPSICYYKGANASDSYWSTSTFSFNEQVYTPAFVDPKGHGCYLKERGTFMVMDDLTVTPLFMISSLSTLMQLGVPFTDIEELEIDVGLEEALNILKASLMSTSVLTDGLKLNAVRMNDPKQEC